MSIGELWRAMHTYLADVAGKRVRWAPADTCISISTKVVAGPVSYLCLGLIFTTENKGFRLDLPGLILYSEPHKAF